MAVLSNVLALSMGGIWALWLTGTHFSISAAVGFVSLVRRGDHGRPADDFLFQPAPPSHGMPLDEAILQGAEKRMRPMMMTALTAIMGLLPAALALRPAWDAAGPSAGSSKSAPRPSDRWPSSWSAACSRRC